MLVEGSLSEVESSLYFDETLPLGSSHLILGLRRLIYSRLRPLAYTHVHDLTKIQR